MFLVPCGFSGGSRYCVGVSARSCVERRWLRGGIARLKGLETLRFEDDVRHSDWQDENDWICGAGRDMFLCVDGIDVAVSLGWCCLGWRGVVLRICIPRFQGNDSPRNK